MENIVYISIGSNMGNRKEIFADALRLLQNHSEIQVVDSSSLYETEPVGFLDQEDFLNAVIKAETSLKADELLVYCLQIEKELGRKRIIRWGPRTLDLDILLYNHENIETEDLIIPHPRILDRAFVIIPLLEIDPHITLPKMETPLRVILDNMQDKDKEGVRLWKQKNGEGVFALFES
ncbi:2-amino-4-hydroxy-6-hydroxymethyldihydropteridine diphosphokinase [Peribacillus sp. B-H-3]|uniref:2-amino-4-hydroxy-6- hydroxymethyldihydropteridine diphosphokinase n=1 Tax=Peribacillus sp. B-H-3 TaxID=3400420 RepID=UPI003B023799